MVNKQVMHEQLRMLRSEELTLREQKREIELHLSRCRCLLQIGYRLYIGADATMYLMVLAQSKKNSGCFSRVKWAAR